MDRSLWKDVLVAKYGDHILHNVTWSNFARPYFSSCWWKDINDLEVCVDSRVWLDEVIERKLGNGTNTRFWRDLQLGDSRLCDKFPRLFSLSLQKEIFAREVGVLEGGRRVWNLRWRRGFFNGRRIVLLNFWFLLRTYHFPL
jgi:hypothetical protein